MPIQAPFWVVFGISFPGWDTVSAKPPKDTCTDHNGSNRVLTMPVCVLAPEKLPRQKSVTKWKEKIT